MPRKKKKNSRLGHEGGRRHERVKAQLRAMAVALKPGMALPSQRQLLCKLDVARGTLTRAVQALSAEGIISVRSGMGVYTTPRAGLSTVAFVLYYEPYALSRFDQTLIGFMTEHAADYGLFVESVILGHYDHPDPERMATFHRAIKERRYAAIVSMAAAEAPGWRPELERLGVPLVYNPVAIDYSTIEKLGVKMLCEHGASQVACFYGCGQGSSHAERFRAVLKHHGLRWRAEWYVAWPEDTPLELFGYRMFAAHWKQWEHKPDGLLSDNDQVTRGLLDAALDLGIKIPGELQIATHANKGLSYFPTASVMRVEVDVDRMARMMLEKVRDKINGRDIAENTPLELCTVE